MTNSQRKSLELSEARTALNGLIEKRNKLDAGTEPSAEDVAAMDSATRKVSALEVEYRAALVTEQDAEKKRATDDPDGEETEKRRLLCKASILPFINEAADDRKVEGVEKELRAALLGDDAERHMPVDLLLPVEELQARAAGRVEHRADTVTPVSADATADGSQASVLERVFTRSVAARLGVSMPSVPTGAAVYPIMTSGTTASQAADGTQVDAGAGAFTGHTLEPLRLTAAYLFNSRQTHQLRNFEAVLRRDLAAVLSDKMDMEIVNGNGSAPNVTGFVSELPTVSNPSTVTDWNAWLDVFTDKVDGLNAYTLGDLRAIIGKGAFTFLHKLFRTGSTDNGPRGSAFEYVRERIGGISVSSRIAAPSSNVQTGIMALTSYPGRNAVAPIWRGMELIRDPYSNAGKGQIRLTAIAFWNFKILREAGWSLFKTKHA